MNFEQNMNELRASKALHRPPVFMRLKAWRGSWPGLKQEDAAKGFNVTLSAFEKWEQGTNLPNPTAELLFAHLEEDRAFCVWWFDSVGVSLPEDQIHQGFGESPLK